MTWKAPLIHRIEPPFVGGERELLEDFLDHHRDTLAWKCEGLNESELKRPSVQPSQLSLLALIRHITDVEYYWFCDQLDGQNGDDLPYYGRGDDPDADFHEASEADPSDAFKRYIAAIADCKAAAARHGLDDVFEHRHHGEVNARWVYLHMIQEYARHNGHADFLRERIDGATGD